MDSAISVVDYIVFAMSLVVCVLIGVYYGYRNRKNTSKEDYFVAGRKMNVVAVGCSALVSTFAATVFLAYPNDTYFRGPGIWFCITIGNICECFALAFIFVPIYHRLKLTNIYDYLEMRFNVVVKYYGVIIQVMFTLFYMAVNIYVPSLAMSVIGGLNLNLSIVFVGGICVLYTTLGGMRAVVWTDVFQTIVIFAGTTAIFILGISEVGGINNVRDAVRAGNRQMRINFSTDLKIPYTFWSAFFGFSVNGLTRSGVGQYIVQRYLTVKLVSEAKLTAVMGQFLSMLLFLCFIFIGLVMYSYYAGCDPLSIGAIETQEQLFPFWMRDLFRDYPGCLGLLVAAMFSSSISTVSSGINSQTVITHAEVTKVFLKNPSPRKAILFTKALSAVIGLIFLFVGFLATYIESIVDSVITWSGILLGPVLGVFTLGMFSRRANSTGALVGLTCSTIVGIWLKIGNEAYPRSRSFSPPRFIDQCDVTTIASVNETFVEATDGPLENVEMEEIPVSLYQLSGVYYGTIAVFLTIVIGMLVSMCTGPLEPGILNEDLFILPEGPYFSSIKKHLPDWLTKTGGSVERGEQNVELSENHKPDSK